jgi:hypothetical protein
VDPVCFERDASPDDPRAGSGGRSVGLIGQRDGIPWGELWPFVAMPIIAAIGWLAVHWR